MVSNGASTGSSSNVQCNIPRISVPANSFAISTQAPGRIDLHDLAGVGDPAIGETSCHDEPGFQSVC